MCVGLPVRPTNKQRKTRCHCASNPGHIATQRMKTSSTAADDLPLQTPGYYDQIDIYASLFLSLLLLLLIVCVGGCPAAPTQ